MNNRGITLIELIVVVTIIGILVVALGFEFVGWMGRYRIESQIKNIYMDMMNTRTRAMQRNRTHCADFPTTTPTTTQYRIREDTDENNDCTIIAGDTVLPTYPKTVEYAMTDTGGSITTLRITFDTRGTIQTGTTLCLSTTTDPDYDCIEISQTRINMGKLTTSIPNGGACNAANCIAR